MATHWIKAAEDNHPWRVVHQDVNTGGSLQSLDIAPFFTNDATLHIVVGQLNGSHRALGRHFATHALHRCHEDHLSLLLGIIHRFALQFIHQASQVLADITLGHMH